jgi:hypothetical protein
MMKAVALRGITGFTAKNGESSSTNCDFIALAMPGQANSRCLGRSAPLRIYRVGHPIFQAKKGAGDDETLPQVILSFQSGSGFDSNLPTP